MPHDFTKLRQALQDPADGPYALIKMRELLIEALRGWPGENYQTADYLLPWGQLITIRARSAIEGLLDTISGGHVSAETNILKLAKMCELLKG
jgi:hypothetical protein